MFRLRKLIYLNRHVILGFLCVLVLLNGCQQRADDEQIRFVKHLCGESNSLFENDEINFEILQIAKESVQRYQAAQFVQANNLFKELILRGCESDKVLAFIALTYAQLGNRDKYTEYMNQSFEFGGNFEIIVFIGFDLIFSEKLDEALRAYEFGLSRINREFEDGTILQSTRYNVKQNGVDAIAFEPSPEERILNHGYCLAQTLNATSEYEFLKAHKFIRGRSGDPVCGDFSGGGRE